MTVVPWFNVKDFGAAGDGAGDDTQSIQAAINAAIAANGGVVYFPPGTYPVAKDAGPGIFAAFSLSGVSNLVFMGDGPASTIKVQDGTYLGDFMVFRLLAGTTRITFLGLRFDGNKARISADEQTHAIEIFDADEIHIERCWFDDTFGDGVRIVGRGATALGGTPLDTADKLLIRDCRFKNWGRSGIGCQRAFKQTRITDNFFESNSGDQAIDFEPTGATSPVEIIIDGNIIMHGTETIAFTIGGINFENNQRFTVTNNLILNGAVFGLALEHFTFTNNVIVNSASSGRSALGLIRHVSDGLIADNIIVSASRDPQTAGVSIFFNNGLAPSRVLLARNIIRSLTTGIHVLGANSIQVIDNVVQTNDNGDQGIIGVDFESTVEGFPVDNPVLRGNLIRNYQTGVRMVSRMHDIHNADLSHNYLENCTNGFRFARSDTGHIVRSPQIIGNVFNAVTTDLDGLQTIDYLVLGGIGAGSVSVFGGNGDPNRVVPAPIGSMFMRFDGGAGNTLYVKESGAGNTGWVAK
ncbi:MAG: right-handed parallel beta-helix repeat-containing protein [Pseudonocardiaceae bacterium]